MESNSETKWGTYIGNTLQALVVGLLFWGGSSITKINDTMQEIKDRVTKMEISSTYIALQNQSDIKRLQDRMDILERPPHRVGLR